MKSKYAQKVDQRPSKDSKPTRRVVSQTMRGNKVVGQQVCYIYHKKSITKHERLV